MEIERTPTVDSLRLMPYSELKKMAKKHGIKGNMKADKIIAALSLSEHSDTESFSTPAQKLINSSKKNKEKIFDRDMKTPLATPRRGTYLIDSPVSHTVDDTPASATSDAFGFEISKVTPEKESVKKLRSRKVSFMSPNMTPHTPRNSNIRLRPKTPIPSLNGNVSLSLSPVQQLQENLENPASLHKTPKPEASRKSTRSTKLLSFKDDASSAKKKQATTPSSTKRLSFKDGASAKKKQACTPSSTKSLAIKSQVSAKKKQVATPSSAKSLAVKSEVSAKKKQIATPGATKSLAVKSDVSAKKKQIATPGSAKSLAVKNEVSAKKKQIATPNFKKIHEKAFEKMESIVDYQKRKINFAKKIGLPDFRVTKAKTKIPAFGGIPFIPSIPDYTRSKPDSKLRNKRTKEVRKPKHEENNTVRKNKSKFDLKASLSRKLGYKPYTGPLKPLTPSNKLNTSSISCFHNAKEPVNKVVNTNRVQNRSALKGVRTNKRFELQMKNRNL